MDIKKKVGDRVKEIRTKEKITQEQLSKYSGIDRTFVSHIEKGTRNISVETIEALLKGMNVSFKYFFGSDKFER